MGRWLAVLACRQEADTLCVTVDAFRVAASACHAAREKDVLCTSLPCAFRVGHRPKEASVAKPARESSSVECSVGCIRCGDSCVEVSGSLWKCCGTEYGCAFCICSV